MNSISVTQKLLTPPSSFKRIHGKSFLYAPYSRTNHRRVYCYTHLKYDLWAYVESDTSILEYNVEVPLVHLACGSKVQKFRPACFAKRRNGKHVLFSIERDSASASDSDTDIDPELEDEDDREDPLTPGVIEAAKVWASEHEFEFVNHTHESLRENPVYLENIKQLLRYVCVPDRYASTETHEQVEMVILKSRQTTIDHVCRSLPLLDEQWILIAIADLILKRKCFSDIDRYPFRYSSVLSLHHEIE